MSEEKKLSPEDISELAKFFSLLIKMDERNKREGQYDKGTDTKEARTVIDKDGEEVIL